MQIEIERAASVGDFKALHHVAIIATDILRTAEFAEHFGLVIAHREPDRIYLRGASSDSYNLVLHSGEQPRLHSIALTADTLEVVERAAKLHGSSVQSLPDPFKGKVASLTDPDNNQIDLVFGIAERSPDALRPSMTINHGVTKERRGTSQFKAPLGAPQLLRLGHVGLFVSNYTASDAWYRKVLGLLPSDLMHSGPRDNVIAGFYRLNRGAQWVDHHTLAMFGMGRTGLHHLSFEVQDSEAQFMGHRWMQRHGHTSVWGVGRHQLGSHVFDVWRDPDGNRFETYSDTDVLTADHKPALSPIEQVGLDLWSDQHFQKYFA